MQCPECRARRTVCEGLPEERQTDSLDALAKAGAKPPTSNHMQSG
jgi:hypothetical protein